MSRVIEQRRGVAWSGLGRAARFLWEAVWLPYWLGSTMPPPRLPGRPAAQPIAGERTPQLVQQLDQLRSTIWRQRVLIVVFRSLWLALLALDAWLFLRVVADRDPAFVPFLLLSLALLALGGILAAIAQPSRDHLARTLDRSFSLHERVATAFETAQTEKRLGGVRALQVLEATRIAGQVGKARAFQPRLPVREIALTAALAVAGVVLLIAMLLPGGLGPGGPGGQAAGPQANGGQASAPGQAESNPSQGPQPGNQPGQNPNGQGAQPGTGPTEQGRQDLATVAGALQGNDPTQQAGNQIANGDYPGAAQSLGEVGEQASQLPQEQREQLAEDLREAAGQVGDPQLAKDLNEAAGALEQPNAAGAQEALDKLAEDIERLGDPQGGAPGAQGNQPGEQPAGGEPGGQSAGNGTGQGQGGTAPQLPGQQRTAPPSLGPATDPLGANGKPVELPKGDPNGATINTQNQGGPGDKPTDPGAAAASGGELRQGEVGEAGVDPNQVPFEQRGTVQQYFTPQPADDGDE
jgi:hypothetical protein